MVETRQVHTLQVEGSNPSSATKFFEQERETK